MFWPFVKGLVDPNDMDRKRIKVGRPEADRVGFTIYEFSISLGKFVPQDVEQRLHPIITGFGSTGICVRQRSLLLFKYPQ